MTPLPAGAHVFTSLTPLALHQILLRITAKMKSVKTNVQLRIFTQNPGGESKRSSCPPARAHVHVNKVVQSTSPSLRPIFSNRDTSSFIAWVYPESLCYTLYATLRCVHLF